MIILEIMNEFLVIKAMLIRFVCIVESSDIAIIEERLRQSYLLHGYFKFLKRNESEIKSVLLQDLIGDCF